MLKTIDVCELNKEEVNFLIIKELEKIIENVENEQRAETKKKLLRIKILLEKKM